MCVLKEEAYACTIFGDNRKCRYEEFLGKPLLSNLGGSLKIYGFSIFSSHLDDQKNSNLVALEADAFARMNKLKLLQLNCSLVALDMQYSRLKNVWEGTKFLWFLKILNLSHSYSLAKTPDVSKLPNLERLVLKSCTSLVQVHESIGSLERLVLLNLEDCKNLRNLPRSICMLKHLETLVISGCSNLEVDGIALNQSLPTNGQVNAKQYFIWPWRLKPRESLEISWPSLPRSLVELSLANCNLSEDDFPTELSNLCSLKKLDLSHNQFHSLPDCIRGLTKLENFNIRSCPRLCKLDGIPRLCRLICGDNRLLEEISFQIPHHPTTTCHLNASNHLEDFLFVTQVCIICTYIIGSKVPPWFNFKNLGSSIDFIIPSYLNSRIRGLNLCSIYEHSDPQEHKPHTVISNRTKGLVWSHRPFVIGTAEDGEDTMWLSYWKFGNRLVGGDEVSISVSGGEFVHVKEVGSAFCTKRNHKRGAPNQPTEI
ncbi:hypothetical protein RHMOL_Rhmol05G0199200 [Rhododendron molle]|uniref:Uncharacterized protein n=1 Tax=Rhododendron molle TaxID=49168 RepID=A0ACC0NSL4_RHOML|nr:hypothetical protein RHMOL_Rhmol05G0199200 [Rhododendron molle]